MNNIPHSPEIEACVLSAMLQHPNLLTRFLGEQMTVDCFWVPAHRTIFNILVQQRELGKDIELVSFIQTLEDEGQLPNVGGHAGISEIYYASSTTAHFTQHCETLRNKNALRCAQNRLRGVFEETDAHEAARAMAEATESVSLILRSTRSAVTGKQASTLFLDHFEELTKTESGQTPGLSTQIKSLDVATAGSQPGELWTIAGKTSSGKSVLMLQLAAAAIEAGKRVLIISLEMNATEIVPRLIANMQSVRLGAMTNPRPIQTDEENHRTTKYEIGRIRHGLENIASSRLIIEDDPTLTIDGIEAAATLHNDEEKVDMVVIDYLQRIESPHRKGESRSDELGRYSRKLKTLAGKIQCPIITASQLNDDGGLYASKIIGHESNIVMRIMDDHIELSKNRHGPRGQKLNLTLNGAMQRFEA